MGARIEPSLPVSGQPTLPPELLQRIFKMNLHSTQTPALCALRYLKTSQATRSDAIATPPLDGAPKQYAPKIHQLVNDIASLTLLEVSDLNELLKKTLNIQDVGMMPMGAMAASAAPAAQVQTVSLIMVKGKAKKLVESLPQEIRANVSKEEAEKLKAALETAGGTVVLE
uniref:Mitochondrial ribosomal protein L12 n=1 Tax=Nothobranchius furzeri TaxID=105023 RepID=A0A8C6LSP3_NOTFU